MSRKGVGSRCQVGLRTICFSPFAGAFACVLTFLAGCSTTRPYDPSVDGEYLSTRWAFVNLHRSYIAIQAQGEDRMKALVLPVTGATNVTGNWQDPLALQRNTATERLLSTFPN